MKHKEEKQTRKKKHTGRMREYKRNKKNYKMKMKEGKQRKEKTNKVILQIE